MNYKDLTLEEKIGQMIMIGLNSNYIDEATKIMITKYKVGGILLRKRNFATYEDMLNTIKELKILNQNNKVPLFIATDQEGGRVNRFPNDIENLPSAYRLASFGGLDIVIKSTNIIANLLYKSGFNVNFAPVLDIKRFDDAHAIGNRSFSDNKELVSKYGIAVMKELQKNNIISVIKHFPGHGATTKDSHFFLPIINKDIEVLEKEDIFPFMEAIKNGADAMLVSHLIIKKETGFFPASLSRKFIVNYLKKKCRYKGLIITDDLKMTSIKLLYGPIRAVKKAFQAGNDIILFRYNTINKKRAIRKIYSLAKHKKIKESQINRSVNKILKIKEKYKISDNIMPEKVDINQINKELKFIRELINNREVANYGK